MKVMRWLSVCLVVLLSGCIFDDGTYKVGETVPSLRTKTLSDVGGDLTRITTYRYPDKRMYQHSLDDALAKNKVILLAFATPGHCTQCDKHLQMLKAALNKYEDDVLFLHITVRVRTITHMHNDLGFQHLFECGSKCRNKHCGQF